MSKVLSRALELLNGKLPVAPHQLALSDAQESSPHSPLVAMRRNVIEVAKTFIAFYKRLA